MPENTPSVSGVCPPENAGDSDILALVDRFKAFDSSAVSESAAGSWFLSHPEINLNRNLSRLPKRRI
ncbi:hypothetical protein AAFF_G00159540 [Aldrovandia affinis]|uniref:Uncharacterized protein n=1 Tax=Aldrovandia affinis TaxID=143900 RepID=A0AAD7VW93_9TELE|nr:hypothetical protein AAFF_G00159540 [Aldrovandia affinis]